MTNAPTDLQKSLHSELDKLFMTSGRRLTWTVDGENESFYHGTVVDEDIEIWLYEDEAECRFGTFHRLCERPDYDSTEQLRDYFLDVVRTKLRSG